MFLVATFSSFAEQSCCREIQKSFSYLKRSHTTMNTGSSNLSLARIVFGLIIIAGSLLCLAQERRVIKFPGTEGLPFSDGVIAGDTLYVAGQEGTDDKGKLAAGGIGPET